MLSGQVGASLKNGGIPVQLVDIDMEAALRLLTIWESMRTIPTCWIVRYAIGARSYLLMELSKPPRIARESTFWR